VHSLEGTVLRQLAQVAPPASALEELHWKDPLVAAPAAVSAPN